MNPPSVAIVGASRQRAKFGNKSVRAHVEAGYRVFPVNPREQEIEGLPCYASLADIPGDSVDRISIYVPPHVAGELLSTLQGFSSAEIWLNPGSADDSVLKAYEHAGLNVIDGCSIVNLGLSPQQFPDE